MPALSLLQLLDSDSPSRDVYEILGGAVDAVRGAVGLATGILALLRGTGGSALSDDSSFLPLPLTRIVGQHARTVTRPGTGRPLGATGGSVDAVGAVLLGGHFVCVL